MKKALEFDLFCKPLFIKRADVLSLDLMNSRYRDIRI